MKTTFLLLLACLTLLRPGAARAQFRVVGYVPAWRGALPDSTQLRRLTHVNYAFVLPMADGGLAPLPHPERLRKLVQLAHQAGVRVLLSVGGWHDGDHRAFDAIGASPRATRAFVAALGQVVADYKLDGIDMDWEHPDATTAAGYAALMQQLAARLHPQGKLLTAAVAGGAWAGPGILPSVFGNVDFLNIMAYDGPPPAHATYAAAAQTLTYWQSRGLPASKTVLGLPFYGQPSQEAYAALLMRGADPKADLFDGVGYNGVPTIERKVRLARDQAGGVMIWELTQDAAGANSLLAAIGRALGP
jgi:chitinase